LLAAFIIDGARVIDITKTIPLLHPGSPADTDSTMTRRGTYNEVLAQSHYEKSYITFAQFLHTYDELAPTAFRPIHRDEAYLRPFQRASSVASGSTKIDERDTQHAPFLLLVKVPSLDDGNIIWARKWIAGQRPPASPILS
jgi:hypothetical protein